MAKEPAMWWYPGDWKRDPRIQAASIVTRGVWRELLDSMWFEEDRSRCNGNITQLSRMANCTKEEILHAIKEIKELKIAEVIEHDNGKITIINRRRRREEEERKSNRERQKRYRKKSQSKKKGKNNIKITEQKQKDNANVTSYITVPTYNIQKEKNITKKKSEETEDIVEDDFMSEEECKNLYFHDDIEYILADLFHENILKDKPNFKFPNLQLWAYHMHILIHEDKRDIETIKKVINWIPNNDFWKNVVLDTQILKRNFDKIEAQMNKPEESIFETDEQVRERLRRVVNELQECDGDN